MYTGILASKSIDRHACIYTQMNTFAKVCTHPNIHMYMHKPRTSTQNHVLRTIKKITYTIMCTHSHTAIQVHAHTHIHIDTLTFTITYLL